MAKRKQQPPDEGSPAWMATFSDLMNLLLCFFVLLFASSTMDAGKIQRIAASFENMSYSVLPQGTIALIKGAAISGGVTQLPDVMSVLNEIGYSQQPTGNNIDHENLGDAGDMDGDGQKDDPNLDGEQQGNQDNQNIDSQDDQNQGNDGQKDNQGHDGENENLSPDELAEMLAEEGQEQSEMMYEEIQDMIESYSLEDRQIIDFNSQYVELDMNGAILFPSGEADFSEESEVYLKKIASILVKYRNCIIEIEGHTDNVPMSNGKFENNRLLSTARAASVYEYILTQEDLIAQNIKIAGYGEERPVVSNETAEGRARNRRVVIKIYNQINSQLQEGDSLQ